MSIYVDDTYTCHAHMLKVNSGQDIYVNSMLHEICFFA